MEVRKLLYVTDIHGPEFSGFEPLIDLRSLGLRDVIFFHATRLEGWERMLADFGINSKTFVVEGPMVPGILNTAQREGVSLIAARLNKDTRRLLRASALPVLILPEDAERFQSGQKGMFTHVVFATDWSVASEKALGYLLDFKEVIKELEIVHVIKKKPSVKDMHNIRDKLIETRKKFLDHGIDAEAHVYAGKPPEEIMLAARDYDATCIFMGTTGKSSLRDFFSHSCSYRVAESSVVPTLVIP